jgi:lipid-binding SYLF domain-containing protein
MAQIIEESIASGADKQAFIKSVLLRAHDFVKTETVISESDNTQSYENLYFTDNSYISIWQKTGVSSNTKECEVFIVTPKLNISAFALTHSNGCKLRVVTSQNGDVTVNAVGSSDVLVDGQYYMFALIKCKGALSGDELWGVQLPKTTAISSTTATDYTTKNLCTDDTSETPSAVYIQNSTSSQQFNTVGYNPEAKMVILEQISDVTSEYLSENTFLMKHTPRRYYGDTIIGGKHYYCEGLIAMLDE